MNVNYVGKAARTEKKRKKTADGRLRSEICPIDLSSSVQTSLTFWQACEAATLLLLWYSGSSLSSGRPVRRCCEPLSFS